MSVASGCLMRAGPAHEYPVSCAEVSAGFVGDAALPFNVAQTDLKFIGRLHAKVMMNLANPEQAFALSFVPNDGVGLARTAFMVATDMKIHPLALIHFDHLDDAAA